jgi:tRNA threonylcarbamoyladenosine biosynthesis protein TsaE
MPYMSTDMIWQTSSTSSADTERLGALLGSNLKGGEVIELRSDLGGGKTTFVQGLARGAGSRDRVTSPTFTLSRIYKTKKYQIHHFDFYRLNIPGLLKDQLAEALEGNNVVIVEWANIVQDVLPNNRISVEFKPVATSSEEREIVFEYPESQRQLITRLQSNWPEAKP